MHENHWKDYFTFTKKERQGIIVLLVLIALLTALPWFFRNVTGSTKGSLDEYEQQLAKEVAAADDHLRKTADSVHTYNDKKTTAFTLFTFNPNTLDVPGWKQLGIRDHTIRTIQHYLSKGGRFKKPEDIARIYGLHKDEYERLRPYIHIPEVSAEQRQPMAEEPRYKKPAIAMIDINTADTSAFIALPGIGSRLAWRIVNFRDKLGGFYSVEQVGETYGVPDSTFQQIRQYLQCPSPVIRTININTADITALRLHPYIKWNIANALVQYRGQHGRYNAVTDIQQIVVISTEIYQKIAPYLAVE